MLRNVELKVWAATVGALFASMAVAILEALADEPALLEALPAWARFLIIVCGPTLVVFLGSYAAPHTKRPDLEAKHRRRLEVDE